MQDLTFCDVSPFYCEQGGGIRTYHRAKIEWFRHQDRHRYVLVYPGPRRRVTEVGPMVTLHEVYGPATSRNEQGYRVPLDAPGIWRTVSRLSPDVLELDDPWFSGPLALLMRRVGRCGALLASFYHSDPISTYGAPFLSRRRLHRVASGRLLGAVDRAFFRLQACYDVTVVASADTGQRLRDLGVRRTLHAPFGVDERLFEIDRARGRRNGDTRLLYAGRLDADKDAPLLLDALPHLLGRRDVHVSVVGRGPLAPAFARFSHPRYSYEGFVPGAERMAAIYASHDILLSPGRHETFGLAALEAAAAGLLVVGPDRGATAELLREMASPFIFATGDRKSFVEATVAAIACATGVSVAGSALQGGTCAAGDIVERHRAVARRYGTWSEAIGRLVSGYQDLLTTERRARC